MSFHKKEPIQNSKTLLECIKKYREYKYIIASDRFKYIVYIDIIHKVMKIGSWSYSFDDWNNFNYIELYSVFGEDWWKDNISWIEEVFAATEVISLADSIVYPESESPLYLKESADV